MVPRRVAIGLAVTGVLGWPFLEPSQPTSLKIGDTLPTLAVQTVP